MYAIRVYGKIEVLDPNTGVVIPPFSMVLSTRYATQTEADFVLARIRDANKSTLNEVVEVEQ